jgi:hypothetical protein
MGRMAACGCMPCPLFGLKLVHRGTRSAGYQQFVRWVSEVEKIHACKNDCILYRGTEYEDLEKCPICELGRLNCRKDDDDDENYNKKRHA